MIATNYSTAQMSLEMYKQQVLGWPMKEAKNGRLQSGIKQTEGGQTSPFSSWKNSKDSHMAAAMTKHSIHPA